MKKRFLLLLVVCFMAVSNTFGQVLDDPENLGSFSTQFLVTRGAYPPNYTEPFTHYYFTLTSPMDIIISHCESTLNGATGIFLSDMNGDIIVSNTGDNIYCVDEYAYVIAPCLLPGTYKIDIDWSPGANGSVYTKVEGLRPFITRSAKAIGEFDSYFNYVDTKDTREPYVGYQGDNAYKNSVCYGFYLSCNMDISISHCGSEIDNTDIFLLDGKGNDVTGYWDNSEVIVCDNPKQDRLGKLNLAPGTYYVVSKGAAQKGKITTRITGTKTKPVSPITEFAYETGTIGSYDPLFVFEDTRNTDNPDVGYQGYDKYRNGVCYRFTIPRDMDVEISNCGSKITDTEVYLLDKDGKHLAYNDDYSGVNACVEFQHAYLEMSSLAAGTYYVVSIGKHGGKGEISTRIVCKGPERSVGLKDKNYILTRSFQDAFGASWLDKVDYYDEMGRKVQTVLGEASPIQDDLATLTEYDMYGRVEKSWLQAELMNNNGGYVLPETLKAGIKVLNSNDQAPYSLTEYEPSPLDRPVCEYGAGYDWHSKGKAVRAKYQLANIAGNDSLNCIHYRIRSETESIDTLVSISSTGNYPTGTLDAVWKADEDGNAVIEFKNRFGQLILSRQILNGAFREFYDTYYIYDEWGNLHVVLPPKAADYIKASGSHWSSDTEFILRDYAYLYKYDKRFRVKAKRLPGQDWIRYVYDKSDSPVFTQDGEQRKRGEWSFAITDGLGRVCLTGLCWNNFELSESSLDTIIKATMNKQTGTYKGYSVSGAMLVDAKVMIVNYYDDYDFMEKNEIFDTANVNCKYEKVDGYGERYPDGAQSLLTGVLTAQLDGLNTDVLNYIPTVMYYDYRGRLIQSKGGNHFLGGVEQEYIAYNFAGNPVKRKHVHSLSGEFMQTEEYSYTYDHAGRLLLTMHSLDGGNFVTLTDNLYDELGRLNSVCRNGNCREMETWYEYNVRSWMKSINGRFFSQKLYYNDLRANGTNAPCYNGNISGIDWQAASDNTLRGYDFSYDDLSRLAQANYLEQNVRKEGCFDTSYRYDKHGNPLRIKRYGQTEPNNYGLIDDLFITLNGNQLESVEDAATSSAYNEGFDFKNTSSLSIEYSYDANGSLIKDSNKGIEEIQYNFLHLPNRVLFSDGNVISYLYGADGTKLRTTHIIGNDTTVTDYCGNMIYENGIPVKLLTEAGYMTLNDHEYHYFFQDHQGNNCVVIDQNGLIDEVNHYYPFGGLMSSSVSNAVQPYKYNGKELDRKNGLDWYDYGARMYDAALGRWHAVDPMNEKYYSWSPYTYCKNNPVLRIDLDGKDDYVISRSGRLFNETPIDKRGKGSTDNLYLSSDRSISVTVNQGLLGEMHSMQAKEQKENRVKKSYGSTQDLETAATVFKFAADHTTVEWKLDVYDDNGTRTAVVATDRDPYGVDNGVYAQNKLSVKGEKVIDIHSHLPGGTKGGAGNDFNLAKPQRKNAVYMKDNRVSTDKKGMIYEYIKNASRVNSIRVYDATDLLQYIKRK
mgnify:CR=1 FL=1